MRKIIVITLSFTLAALAALTPAAAKSDCDKVRGEGHTFGSGPFTFQGTAALNVNGQAATAAVTTAVLGPPQESPDGTLRATTSHTFVFPDGSSFTTLDSAVLSPTGTPGLYNLNTRAAVTQGAGAYEAACGKLTFHGTINLASPEAVWRVSGRICDCG